MSTSVPKRPKITAITLHVLMPDGTTRIHDINPEDCDALAWSDRAVEVFSRFYDKGGPAEGKHMSREDFLHHFPHAGALIGDQPHLPMTPEVVNAIWHHPKADMTTPAFLAKSIKNPVNG